MASLRVVNEDDGVGMGWEGGIGGVREAKGEDGEGGVGQWERMGGWGGRGMVEIRRVSKLPYEAT